MILPILWIFNILNRFRGDRDNNRMIATRIFWGTVALFALVCVILFFKACGNPSPEFNENKVQDAAERQKQINDGHFNDSIERGNIVVEQSDAKVADAERQTREATANKSRNINGKDSDKLAEQEK